MPGATPNYGFPYPVLGEAPHGPNQIQALAEAVDAKFLADVATLATAFALKAPLGESQSAVDTTFGTTTSTAWTDALAGGPSVLSLAFTAPPSGKVMIHIKGSARNGGSSNFSGINFRMTGPSAYARAAVDGEQAFVQGQAEVVVTADNIVSGLTPGGVYTVFFQHKVTAGTGTFNYRRIGWRPIAG